MNQILCLESESHLGEEKKKTHETFLIIFNGNLQVFNIYKGKLLSHTA